MKCDLRALAPITHTEFLLRSVCIGFSQKVGLQPTIIFIIFAINWSFRLYNVKWNILNTVSQGLKLCHQIFICPTKSLKPKHSSFTIRDDKYSSKSWHLRSGNQLMFNKSMDHMIIAPQSNNVHPTKSWKQCHSPLKSAEPFLIKNIVSYKAESVCQVTKI